MRFLYAFTLGGKVADGRMRGGLATSTQSWAIMAKPPLISSLRGQLLPREKPFSY